MAFNTMRIELNVWQSSNISHITVFSFGTQTAQWPKVIEIRNSRLVLWTSSVNDRTKCIKHTKSTEHISPVTVILVQVESNTVHGSFEIGHKRYQSDTIQQEWKYKMYLHVKYRPSLALISDSPQLGLNVTSLWNALELYTNLKPNKYDTNWR